MLCFNYTVGFFWSVAVLYSLLSLRTQKDHQDGAWQASPRRHFSRVSIRMFQNRRIEPFFIPKLQNQVADFPYSRFLHIKGYLPWRPDAVISTDLISYALASFHGARNYAHDELPRRVTTVLLRLELSSSIEASPLGRYDGPAALVPHREAMQCVAAIRSNCWDLSQLPFRQLFLFSHIA